MAGRIIDNTIVAGYPEPGVTADEIVGLVNKYGMPLGTLDRSFAKQYADTNSQMMVNASPNTGPASASRTVALESWNLPSNVHVSVIAQLFGDTLSTPVDDNTYAGVSIFTDATQQISTYGSIGQSAIDGANNVGFHSIYEAHWVGRIDDGVAVNVVAKFTMGGTLIVARVENDGVFVTFRINITRVIE